MFFFLIYCTIAHLNGESFPREAKLITLSLLLVRIHLRNTSKIANIYSSSSFFTVECGPSPRIQTSLVFPYVHGQAFNFVLRGQIVSLGRSNFRDRWSLFKASSARTKKSRCSVVAALRLNSSIIIIIIMYNEQHLILVFNNNRGIYLYCVLYYPKRDDSSSRKNHFYSLLAIDRTPLGIY